MSGQYNNPSVTPALFVALSYSLSLRSRRVCIPLHYDIDCLCLVSIPDTHNQHDVIVVVALGMSEWVESTCQQQQQQQQHNTCIRNNKELKEKEE